MMAARFGSLEAFQSAIDVVPAAVAEDLRERFVDVRVDPRYADEAAEALRPVRFSDGPAYKGYLWDFLSDKEVVSVDELWRRVRPVPEVYAMWDLHSVEGVRIPNYFQFPRGTVIRTDPATLRCGLEYLPEDLYIFDETLKWAGALTHEFVDDSRFCLWSGDGPHETDKERR